MGRNAECISECYLWWRNILAQEENVIFIILGTQKFQLNRLLKEVDNLCETKQIQEEVFAQIGHSDYKPKHYEYVDFLERDAFEEKIKESSLVITHSGVGSIITSIQSGKPVIVYPRLSKYKEHVDDHQLEIAEAFAKKNYVLCCDENDSLIEMIKKSRGYVFEYYSSSTDYIIKIISEFIENSFK